MNDDWPSHNKELTRKTAEQLELWAERYDRGVITLSTMISVVSAIYDTTSGLIERPVSDLLAEVHRDLVAKARQKAH